MGYYLENGNIQKSFIKHNILRLSIKAVFKLFGGVKIKKTRTRTMVDPLVLINASLGDFEITDQVDLLSICVLPEYRGSGIAEELIGSFEEKSRQLGRKAIALSVLKENTRAISFYKKRGYELKSENNEKEVLVKVLPK